MDVKVLRETDAAGLQRWEPILKATFPLDEEAALVAFRSLDRPPPDVPPEGLDLEAVLAAAAVGTPGGPRALLVRKTARPLHGGRLPGRGRRARGRGATDDVHRRRVHGPVGGAGHGRGARPQRLHVNHDVPTGLRMLVDRVPERFAVIDAGTNSTKFHVAEIDADTGAWRTVVDRAVVTRLGEGLEATGEIGAVPLDRTAQAIREMADEARRLDARAIAAVGTAGLRIATNQAEVLERVRDRSGVALEVISGEDEGRLAHLAVATGIGLDDGPIVVFDTGGGSSQFTFGHGAVVDERFSLNVGAVRFTEQFGLAHAVSAEVVAEAVAAIGAELGRLDGRPRPHAVVAMGGAVTNLAAVRHGLTTYDPEVIQGTVLDRAEIDRQIELYRGLDADGRRQIPGLQPARAEVILAGACIVRTIIDKLGCRRGHRQRPRPAARRAARALRAERVRPSELIRVLSRPRAEPPPPGRRCRGCVRGRSARTRRPASGSAAPMPSGGPAAT